MPCEVVLVGPLGLLGVHALARVLRAQPGTGNIVVNIIVDAAANDGECLSAHVLCRQHHCVDRISVCVVAMPVLPCRDLLVLIDHIGAGGAPRQAPAALFGHLKGD